MISVRLGRGHTVADAGDSRRRVTPLGVGPALKNPTTGRPEGESVLTRDRHAIVAMGADGGYFPGEDRGQAGLIKGGGKGVGMS